MAPEPSPGVNHGSVIELGIQYICTCHFSGLLNIMRALLRFKIEKYTFQLQIFPSLITKEFHTESETIKQRGPEDSVSLDLSFLL